MLGVLFFSLVNELIENSTERGEKMEELNIRQDRFLKALLSQATIEQACKQAKINKTTGYKYLKDERFLLEYRKLRRESMQQVTARLQKASEQAVDVIVSVMLDEDNPPNVRQTAAKNVLDIAYRSIELNDISERMETLEKTMNRKDVTPNGI